MTRIGRVIVPVHDQDAAIAFYTEKLGFSVTADVPFGENGRYAMSVAMPRLENEPAGPPAHAVTHVWVAGDRADVGFSGDRLEVIADKDEYAIGDKARFLVLAPVGSSPSAAMTSLCRRTASLKSSAA